MSRVRPLCRSRAAPRSVPHPEVTEMPASAVPSRLAPRALGSRAWLLIAGLLIGVAPAAAVTPRVHAIRNARIVTGPGNVIARGTIVMRDGLITAVGANVAIPADARVWEGDSLTIYPGLIDAFVMPGAPAGAAGGAPFGGGRPGGGQQQPEAPRGPVHELSAVR